MQTEIYRRAYIAPLLKSVQRHAATDVGGNVEVGAAVNGWFAFFETTSGNNFQIQQFLSPLAPLSDERIGGTFVEQVASAFGRALRRWSDKTIVGTRSGSVFDK